MPKIYCIGGTFDGSPIDVDQPPRELHKRNPMSGASERYLFQRFDLTGPNGEAETAYFYVAYDLPAEEAEPRAKELHERIQLHGDLH